MINNLLDNKYIIAIVTWMVLAFEVLISMACVMQKKFKIYLFIPGVTFHFIIAIIHGLPGFFLMMTALLILYLLDYNIAKNIYYKCSFFKIKKIKFLLIMKIT